MNDKKTITENCWMETLGVWCMGMAIMIFINPPQKSTGIDILMGIASAMVGYGLFLRKIKFIKLYELSRIIINSSIVITIFGAFMFLFGAMPKSFLPADRESGFWVLISGLVALVIGLLIRMFAKRKLEST